MFWRSNVQAQGHMLIQVVAAPSSTLGCLLLVFSCLNEFCWVFWHSFANLKISCQQPLWSLVIYLNSWHATHTVSQWTAYSQALNSLYCADVPLCLCIFGIYGAIQILFYCYYYKKLLTHSYSQASDDCTMSAVNHRLGT